MSTPENANPEKIDSEISQEEKLARRLLEMKSEWGKILDTSIVPLEQKLNDFVTEVEKKASEVLKKLSEISDEENEEPEETEEEEVVETKIEKLASPKKSSDFLNCGNQLVIRKDAFSHAYHQYPSDNRQVRIWFSVKNQMQTYNIDVLPGEAGSVIRNIYNQLSE